MFNPSTDSVSAGCPAACHENTNVISGEPSSDELLDDSLLDSLLLELLDEPDTDSEDAELVELVDELLELDSD